MTIARWVPLLAALALLPACSSTKRDTARPLQPATAVEQSRAAAAASTVPVGQPAALPGGTRLTVTALDVSGDGAGPWLAATVHVENTSGDDGEVPTVGIMCADTTPRDLGGYQIDSTLRLGDNLPARSFADGTLNLLLPHDSRTGRATPECAGPAFLEARPLVWDGDTPPTVRVAIPEPVLAELNAKRHA